LAMLWRAAFVLVAAAAALLPFPTTVVERTYSTSLYPRLQSLLTPASNHVPFALFDALIAIVAAGWLLAVGFDILRYRPQWARLAGRLIMRTAVWTAALYLFFLLTWGLNYRREKLSDKLQFDATTISADAARSMGVTSVNALNALHGRAHSVGWAPFGSIDPSLANAFDKVQEDLGARSRFAVSRPKATLLDFYFRRAGVAGMTNPYFLETLVERDLLPFERPFVVAHEWSHLAGFADESEANFVGWLTCLRGSIPEQYSGWLFLYDELAGAVSRGDRSALVGQLAAGPRADLQAITQRLRRQISPAISAAGWRVYDRYLKANRVEAGARSYAEVVRLVLGVRFGPQWTPRLREKDAPAK
jgi:Protein of unknown function (DUF3810)